MREQANALIETAFVLINALVVIDGPIPGWSAIRK